MGGKVDAATRVKLLKELDTQDDHKLHIQLVKSEDARKAFISKLQSQRLLQVEKASQRLLKADEKREARLVQLDIIKQQQAERAKEMQEKDKARQGTQAQLELLMKQKEAQAIRKLVQEKDEQERGMGKEKDVARQRRKMQERSANEVKAIEAERAKQLGRKRDDQVAKREVAIAKKSRGIAEKVFQIKEARRAVEARRRAEKDQLLEEMWQRKSDAIREKEKKMEAFAAMEEVREGNCRNRERRRAHNERDRFRALRDAEAKEEEETLARRNAARKEQLLQWQIAAQGAASERREIERRNVGRERKIQAREELRLRRFRETQFLETQRSNAFGGAKKGDDSRPGSPSAGDGPQIPEGSSAAEIEAFQKSFEEQERQRRRAERQEKLKQDEAKQAKMQQLTGPDPTARELARIAKWRAADDEKKQRLQNAKLKQELEAEARMDHVIKATNDRSAVWAELEEKRRAASQERTIARREAVAERTKKLPVGLALPRVFVF